MESTDLELELKWISQTKFVIDLLTPFTNYININKKNQSTPDKIKKN